MIELFGIAWLFHSRARNVQLKFTQIKKKGLAKKNQQNTFVKESTESTTCIITTRITLIVKLEGHFKTFTHI